MILFLFHHSTLEQNQLKFFIILQTPIGQNILKKAGKTGKKVKKLNLATQFFHPKVEWWIQNHHQN